MKEYSLTKEKTFFEKSKFFDERHSFFFCNFDQTKYSNWFLIKHKFDLPYIRAGEEPDPQTVSFGSIKVWDIYSCKKKAMMKRSKNLCIYLHV